MTTTASANTAGTILDKHLRDLTEDDISQLTREDCRRYLKLKGMRRPSWNKSQAIQQVISLKSLLEPPAPVHATTPPPAGLSRVRVGEVDDGASDPQDVSSGSDPLREDDSTQPPTDHRVDSVRDAKVPDILDGQMTIFYCGKVNVYDGIPPDKAETIIQLATSSVEVLHSEPVVGNPLQRETTGHFSGSGIRFNLIPPRTILSQMLQTDVDGQTNRQVSLQRYREKREERGRFKIRKKIGPSSGLDMYMNQHMRMQAANKQLRPGSTSPPIQPGQSRVHCSSMENQLKQPRCSLDLNDKA